MRYTRQRSSGRCGKIIVGIIFILLVVSSLPAQEQEMVAEARAAGERDAELDANRTLWFAAGCLGGITGLLVSYIYTPSPPAVRLLGKSPEYVAVYTDAYRQKARKIQSGQALLGCGVACGAYVAYFVILFSSLDSE